MQVKLITAHGYVKYDTAAFLWSKFKKKLNLTYFHEKLKNCFVDP